MERRKIIRQGKGTLTMSLPAQWVRELGLHAGDDIAVDRRGLQLIVGPLLRQRQGKKSEIDLREFSKTLVYTVVANLYIRGDDEIRVYFEPEQYPAVVDVVRTLIGFQIVEQTKNTCLLKELARGESEDFDTLLRRIFLLILSIAEDGLEALKVFDRDTLMALENRDESVNTLVQYCLRVLNKRGGGDVQRAMHLYTLLTLLEQLGDDYIRFYRNAGRIKPRTLGLASRVVALTRGFYDLFYKFDKAKASKLKEERDVIRAEIDKVLSSTAIKEDLIVLHHLLRIADLVVDIEKFNLAMQL